MKKFFYFLALLTMTLSVQAKTLNASTFTLNYDATKWKVQDMGFNNAMIPDAYSISNTSTNNYIFLVFYDMHKDAKAFFKEQVTERANRYFSDVILIGSCQQVTYKGKTAYKQQYKKRFTTSTMEGTVLVFNINNGVFFAYSLIPNLKDDKFMSMLNTLQFKEVVTKRTLEDMLRNMSSFVKENKPHLDKGIYMFAFDPDLATKTVTYKCKCEKMSASEMEYLPSMKSLFVRNLCAEIDSNEFSKEMLMNQYSIVYEFYDEKNQQACSIVITPDDYNALLSPKKD